MSSDTQHSYSVSHVTLRRIMTPHPEVILSSNANRPVEISPGAPEVSFHSVTSSGGRDPLHVPEKSGEFPAGLRAAQDQKRYTILSGKALMKVQREAVKWQVRLLASGALCCAPIVAFGAQSQSQPKSPAPQAPPPLIRSVNGPDLFRAYCASCHGKDAKGNGPAAVALKPKVPDLTLLAKNNGGKFPEDRVRKTILGDDALAAHGSREMPVWGPVFHQIENDVDWGHVRVANLAQYLKSIQSLK